MIIRRVRLWSGFDPTSEGWALREITNLCGLTLGDQGGVEEDLGGPATGPDSEQVADRRQNLRLVSGHGSLR